MLAICHVDIADDVDDAAVGLLWQTLVFATVACLHVEDGYMQAFGSDDAEAGVGVAEHQYGIWLGLHHYLIALVNDVADSRTKVVAYSLHVDVGLVNLQILEEDAVEVVVVVLTCVCKQCVEILPAFIYHCCQTDYLRSGADDDQQLQFAVVLKLFHSMCRGDWGRNSRLPTLLLLSCLSLRGL